MRKLPTSKQLIERYQDILGHIQFVCDATNKEHYRPLPWGWLIHIIPRLAELLRDVDEELRHKLEHVLQGGVRGQIKGSLGVVMSWNEATIADIAVMKKIGEELNDQIQKICEYCGEPGELHQIEMTDVRISHTACADHRQRLFKIAAYLNDKKAMHKLLEGARKSMGWSDKECHIYRNRRVGHSILRADGHPPDDLLLQRDGVLQGLQVLRGKLALCKVDFQLLDYCKHALDTEFPWMAAATDKILLRCEIGLRLGNPLVSLNPILLVGPRGSGKSRYTRRLSELLSLPCTTITMGGSNDNKMLTGTSKAWGNAQPSDLIKFIASSQTANPLVILEEIDKESQSQYSGRASDTLHILLERETAARWHDLYLQESCDLSRINWIATANHIEHLSDSLLSRFIVIKVGKPVIDSPASMIHAMRGDIAAQYQVDINQLPAINAEEMKFIQQKVNRGASLRVAQRMVEYLVHQKLYEPARFGDLH